MQHTPSPTIALRTPLRPGRPWAVRWWHALQAAWQAGMQAARGSLARDAPTLPPQALHSLEDLDERMLADIGLPPATQALVMHERVRHRDALWTLSRGAVAPSVERSFY